MPLREKVVPDMPPSGRQARAGVGFLVRGAGQRQRRGRDFRLGQIGVLREVRDLRAVKIAALKIHASVGSGGVLAQNAIEQDHRLENSLPGNVADIAKASYTNARPVGTGWVLRHFRSAGGDLFQQDQLQRWNQCPQFHHLSRRVFC